MIKRLPLRGRAIGYAICAALISLVLYGVGWLTWNSARPDVYFHSVSLTIRDSNGEYAEPVVEREVTGWRRRIFLSPKEFEVGADRSLVQKKIKNAGYYRILESSDWGRLDDLREHGHFGFIRDASNLVCGTRLGIFVAFDESDKLISAQGSTKLGGCL